MGGNRVRARRTGARAGKAVLWRSLQRRHLRWGGIAVLASLLLHAVLLLFFPGFTMYGFVHPRPVDKARLPPVHLQEVTVHPEVAEADRRPPRFRPETARGTAAGEIGAEATAFRREIDEAAVEPRALDAGVLIGEQRSLVEPAPVDRPLWEPREEVLSINQRIAADDKTTHPRRLIPIIPRLSGAQDIVSPADRLDLGSGLVGTGAYYLVDDPAQFAWGRRVGGGGEGGGGGGVAPPKEILREEPRKPPEEGQDRVAVLKALEKYLKADIYVYRPFADSRYAYCRIEIKRRSDNALPVLPKDLLIVQDASASITEQKLHFCREGMLKVLDRLGPDDRFNVVEFRDATSRCFPEWSPVNPGSLAQAREFIESMRAIGNTDIFGSLQELLTLPRKPGRPVILQVISDGVATAGMTDQSQIIEAFSQENKGMVSVFTVGTYPGANAYLLDLLSYRNRGDTSIVRTGRWDIPAVIEQRVREISRPVLSDVRFRFAGQTYCEVYPVMTSNLYLDRPLVVFGRYSRDAKRLVFQARGQADDIQCDMVFDIDLATAMSGEKDICTDWAWQKAYYLIGEHNRTKRAEIVDQLRQVGKTYGIRIPYKNELEE